MEFYAHIDKHGNREPLADHLNNTANLASDYGSKFGARDSAYACGLFHDVGKATIPFLGRLGGNPERVDHSTAGAQHLYKAWGDTNAALVVGHCITGHHGGLQNHNDYCKRLVKEVPQVLWTPDIIEPPTLPQRKGFAASFYTRMNFSCLVDSDYINTEHVMNRWLASLRCSQKLDPESLLDTLLNYIKRLAGHSSEIVQEVRNQILANCLQTAVEPQGFYSFTSPTGSGKTLSSMAFALLHAATHKLDRIIYAVPYISITEQIVDEFRRIFPGKVVEHHSNLDLYGLDKTELLATENWDAPIIVTTNVQLFESLYGSRPSTCRKLHNITRSVIVLDEAQMLPIPVLYPCLEVLKELVDNYGVSAVLCTATQPAITYRKAFAVGPRNVREIVNDPIAVHQMMRRTETKHLGPLTKRQLVKRLAKIDTGLCVVNSRKSASDIYLVLREAAPNKNVIYLNTLLCGDHRSERIQHIKKLLNDKSPCIVISTSLIQAGVDLDFPVVYREWIGLDSLAQTGGRCNRNGNNKLGIIYTFYLRGAPKNNDIIRQCEAARAVSKQYRDLGSLEAIRQYFLYLYPSVRSTNDHACIDHGGVVQSCSRFQFRDAAENMRLIPQLTHPILAPYGEGVQIIEELRQLTGKITIGMKRRMQRYVVPLYDKEFAQAIDCGMIEILPQLDVADNEDPVEGYAVLKPEYYHQDMGFNAILRDHF